MDEILTEVRRIRAEIAERHGGELSAYARQLRERGDEVVRREPRRTPAPHG